MRLDEYLFFHKVQVQDLAKELEITDQYLSLIKNDKAIPSIKVARWIEEATKGRVEAKQWDHLRKPRSASKPKGETK